MKKLFLLVFFLLLADSANTHLCDNIFRRQDLLVLKPERDLIRIAETGEFRIFIKNNYPAALHNVRLIGISEAFKVDVSPKLIEELRPGEKSFFLLKLTPRKRMKPGDYPLEIMIGAKQFNYRRVSERVTISLEISLKEELKTSLKDPSWHVRILAAERLNRMGDESGIPVLAKALSHEDRIIRGFAARALGEGCLPSAVPLLKKAMEDPDDFVRGNAALALGAIGDTTAIPLLKEALNAKDRFLQVNAAAALAIMGEDSMTPLLRKALKDKDPLVRVSAAEGLGRTGDISVIPFLEKALKHKDPVVRLLAGKALVKIKRGALIKTPLLFSALTLLTTPGFEQIEDLFRVPGFLVVEPEKDSMRITELRVFIKNNYPIPVHNVQLVVESQAFKARVEPAVIPEIKPGEKKPLNITLTPTGAIGSGEHPLLIKVGARRLDLRLGLEMVIREGIIRVKREADTIPVGRVIVRVDRFAGQRYLLYLIPILVLLGFLFWRKLRGR